MTPNSEKEVIFEHALRNEENLELALKIGSHYDELCQRILISFIGAVASSLKQRLDPTWNVVVGDPARFSTQYAELIRVEYSEHPGQFMLNLRSHEPWFPKRVYIAVGSSASSDQNQAVKVLLNEFTKGLSSGDWFWYRYVDKNYSHWGSPESTFLHFSKDETVEYFAGNISQLARIIENALKPTFTPSSNS